MVFAFGGAYTMQQMISALLSEMDTVTISRL